MLQVPLPVAVSCAKSYGRSPQAIALLECFSAPLPRQWELLAEQEGNAAAGEVSLLLEDELAAEEEVEAPLAAELHYTHVAYVETAEEQATVARYKLDRVPPALEAQLQQYKDWRLQPLNFQRAGNAVVDTTAYAPRGTPSNRLFFCVPCRALPHALPCATVRCTPLTVETAWRRASDTATALRFLAYAKEAHGASPNLKVLGTAALPTIVQAWLEQMVERGLMWSSLSNYVNSLCNLAGWWWDSDGAVEEAAYALDPQPPTALIRLRAQCEQQSKQQRLYAKKPANWIDWDTAQEARLKCARAWADAGRLGHDARIALLLEYLVLLFHTVMPPDVRPRTFAPLARTLRRVAPSLVPFWRAARGHRPQAALGLHAEEGRAGRVPPRHDAGALQELALLRPERHERERADRASARRLRVAHRLRDGRAALRLLARPDALSDELAVVAVLQGHLQEVERRGVPAQDAPRQLRDVAAQLGGLARDPEAGGARAAPPEGDGRQRQVRQGEQRSPRRRRRALLRAARQGL